MKNVAVCLVSTKNYVFYVPKKTVGLFFVLNTIKTHQLFDGVSIEAGVRKIVDKAESVEGLESSMIALLEDEENSFTKLTRKKPSNFVDFLGNIRSSLHKTLARI
jgi:hypothetical protein